MGGGGFDLIEGGPGNDWLGCGSGADELLGGSVTDTAAYDGSPVGVFVWLAANGAHYGDAEGDYLAGIENLNGSGRDDDLWGDDGANVLAGMTGNDDLKGIGGADTLLGGEGNDDLAGGAGNDVLDGGNGVDTISGGMDIDSLTGGFGADTFVWLATAETGVTLATLDVVLDFNPAQGDLINLHGIDADETVGGNQDFVLLPAGSQGFTAPGQILVGGDGTDTILAINTDADLDTDAAFRIAGMQAVNAFWFVL
jgi:serralysin